MSPFEKKTLAYVICWASAFMLLGPAFALRDSWIVWLILCVVIVVQSTLYTIFGLWNLTEVSGGFREYFREDNLTEREKFLLYKSITRTVSAFFLTIVFLTVGYILVNGLIYERFIELTIDNRRILTAFPLLFIAFLTVKSSILFVYIRNERLGAKSQEASPPSFVICHLSFII